MIETVIWALPAGETDRLYEQVMSTNTRNATDIAKVIAAAGKDGWHSFRVTKLDLSQSPDFSKVLQS